MSAAQRGDEAELFERHSERLLGVVQRAIGGRGHVAEDACSFAWLQLLRTQPERDSIFPWLCTVAINEARRMLKGQARHAEFEEGPGEPVPARLDRHPDLEQTLDARQALELIAAELSEQRVRIFSLHVAGLTYDEICAVTGFSRRQVDRQIVRSRARLRKRYEQEQRPQGEPPCGGEAR